MASTVPPISKRPRKAQLTNMYVAWLAPSFPSLTKTNIRGALMLCDNDINATVFHLNMKIDQENIPNASNIDLPLKKRKTVHASFSEPGPSVANYVTLPKEEPMEDIKIELLPTIVEGGNGLPLDLRINKFDFVELNEVSKVKIPLQNIENITPTLGTFPKEDGVLPVPYYLSESTTLTVTSSFSVDSTSQTVYDFNDSDSEIISWSEVCSGISRRNPPNKVGVIIAKVKNQYKSTLL